MSTIDTRRGLRRRAEAAHWLLKLREDPLPDAQMETWLEWSSDPENLIEFEAAQSIHTALRGSPAAETAVRRHPRLLGKRRFLAAAASVLLTVAAGLLYYLASSTAPAAQTYSTGKAIHREIVLADGSQAILGAHSRLRVSYGPRTRRVTVEGGEAYFQVRKDSARPFVVEAGKLSVTAVGTAFDVRRDDDRVVVTVGEGSVDVVNQISGNPAAQLRARAGERVTAQAGLPALTVAAVSPSAAGNWRHGALEFTGEPLHVVVANLNRYLANEITIRDAEIGQWIYSGTVQPARVDEWLSALAEVFPLHVAGGRALALRDATPD